MPNATTQTNNAPASDAQDGEVTVTLPKQDTCCESPCDPRWRLDSTCITFTETKTAQFPLGGAVGVADFARGFVTVKIVYQHKLCLIGKQHGGLAYTVTLLPGEKMTLYHSDRYRRTTSEQERFSVQTTFSQFVSALHQSQTTSDFSFLNQVLNSSTSSSGGGGGASINLGIFSLGGGGSGSSTTSGSTATDLSVQASADSFTQIAEQAAQYTDLQRSIVVSSYEDSESVSTTSRLIQNDNLCRAVTYFVRKVLDVYLSTTKVVSVTFRVTAGNYVSGFLTPAQIGQVTATYRPAAVKILQGLPKVGDVVEQPNVLTVPTDGVVYDPELAHCCASEPEREAAVLIQLERDKAAALRAGLELQLLELEIQRRQMLLAAGTLAPFEPALPAPIIAA